MGSFVGVARPSDGGFYCRMTWREKLEDARERSKMTQAQLAEAAGVKQQTIHKYESGNAKPRLDVLLRLCAALDVSLDYLFDETRKESMEIARQFQRAVRKLGGVERALDRLTVLDEPGILKADKVHPDRVK